MESFKAIDEVKENIESHEVSEEVERLISRPDKSWDSWDIINPEADKEATEMTYDLEASEKVEKEEEYLNDIDNQEVVSSETFTKNSLK